MNTLTNEEKLKKIIVLTELHDITAYEIAKNTTITEAGVGRILNKVSKKPHTNTVNSIYNYVIKYEKKDINYTTEEEKLPVVNEKSPPNYNSILIKLKKLIKELEEIEDPDLHDLKNLKDAYDFRSSLTSASE